MKKGVVDGTLYQRGTGGKAKTNQESRLDKKCKNRGMHGGVGNTLEDLLGIEENNLPIPNAAEWELKSTANQHVFTNTTLFHSRAIAPRSKNSTSDSLATVRLGAPGSRRKISSR